LVYLNETPIDQIMEDTAKTELKFQSVMNVSPDKSLPSLMPDESIKIPQIEESEKVLCNKIKSIYGMRAPISPQETALMTDGEYIQQTANDLGVKVEERKISWVTSLITIREKN
jgi:hypothetical protein